MQASSFMQGSLPKRAETERHFGVKTGVHKTPLLFAHLTASFFDESLSMSLAP